MKWWKDYLLTTINQMTPIKSGSSMIYGPTIIEDVDLQDVDPFKMCCYTNQNGKLTLLSKNYFNKASIEEAKLKLKGNNTIVSVSLIGQPKHGSVKNKDFCMYTMFINKDTKRASVIFRNSDFIKKLPIDVYWIKNVLFKELNIENYHLDLIFNRITVRVPFYYILLNTIYEDVLKKEDLGAAQDVIDKALGPQGNIVAKEFIKWYNKPTPNYKSLERAGRRMRELDVYKIIKAYLNEGAN